VTSDPIAYYLHFLIRRCVCVAETCDNARVPQLNAMLHVATTLLQLLRHFCIRLPLACLSCVVLDEDTCALLCVDKCVCVWSLLHFVLLLFLSVVLRGTDKRSVAAC